MRFRADQRLRRQQDFRAARERGRRIECGGFTFWYVRREAEPITSLPSSDQEGRAPTLVPKVAPRVGVVASTASVGNAVRRARAKRRLREVFRKHQTRVPGDVDLLLVARNSLNRLPFAEIEKKFVEACQRAFGV